MIYKLSTDFPEFKPIFFRKGINIILPKRAENTSNGVGKTILLACIDYVLGANYKESILTGYPELQGITISLTMDYMGEKMIVSRNLDKVESKTVNLRNEITGETEQKTVVDWKKGFMF